MEEDAIVLKDTKEETVLKIVITLNKIFLELELSLIRFYWLG